jgi:hypothetical protein
VIGDHQLVTFWACQCPEPDIDGVTVERRQDGDRVIEVRSCRECWGDVAVDSTT